MSHFTTVKTEIADLDALKRSLTKAGVKFRINADVRGYVGQTTKAAVVIEGIKGYDIGVQTDGTLVADWWGVESFGGKTETEAVNEIVKRYAVEKIITACSIEGYNIAESDITIDADGSVQLLAAKWG